MSKDRLQWIDTARGVGILMVVFLHTLSPVMEGQPFMTGLYKCLLNISMPLFFLLSGMVGDKLLLVQGGSRHALLRRSAARLLIPYFAWALIYLPMKIVLHEQVRFAQTAPLWTILIGNNPAGQLWFLYVLFLLRLVTIYAITPQNLRYWCAAGLAVSFLAPLIPDSIRLPGIGLSFSLQQVGFYFAGLALISRRDHAFRHPAGAVVGGAVCALFIALRTLGQEAWFLHAPASLGGCCLLLFCVRQSEGGRLAAALAALGKRSMAVYILHAPLLVVGRTLLRPVLGALPWVYALLLCALAVAASLLISRLIIRRSKVLSRVLLGA